VSIEPEKNMRGLVGPSVGGVLGPRPPAPSPPLNPALEGEKGREGRDEGKGKAGRGR